MNTEHNRAKVALALIVMVGVIAIVVGTVVGGTSSSNQPERDCPYTSGCAYTTTDH
jgi:hypothetical protein